MTKGLAASVIQEAIYTLLVNPANTALAALVGTRIYNAVPQGVFDPYLILSVSSEVTDDTLEDGDAGNGSDCIATIEGVSDDQKSGAGDKTVQAIASEVKALLHLQPLSLGGGWVHVSTQHEDTVIIPDQDEAGRIKRHSTSNYRILAEAA